jgi:AcrR family transcriptional regulator
MEPRQERRAETRARLVAAAYALFHARGFTRVGVDDVAAAAGVTKRTLYDHFPSKDDLAEAAAAHHAALAEALVESWLGFLRADPRRGVEHVFDALEAWVAAPDFAGAGFSRIAYELADLPGHPVRGVARRHKARVLDLLAGALGSTSQARELMIVLEGALTLALVSGDRASLAAGRALALRVVDGP